MSMTSQFDRKITNMGSMMEKFGIDPMAFPPELLGSAIRVCLTCRGGEACDDWLAQVTTSPQQAQAFCPNAQMFEQAREKGDGSTVQRLSPSTISMSYFRASNAPRTYCEGGLKDLGWEGRIDDPSRPKKIHCPVCGATMNPEFDACAFYEIEGKEGIVWASVPAHLPGKRPMYY